MSRQPKQPNCFDLTVSFWRYKLLFENCVVKRLVVTLLVFNAFTLPIFGQTGEQKDPIVFPSQVEIIRGTERTYENVFVPTAERKDLQRLWSGWLRKVEGAERDYKDKNGRYGDLAALRKAHLLGSLVFESCSSTNASGEPKANFVPKSTLIQVTLSEDRQNFHAVIVDGAGHCYRPPNHPVPQQPIYWDTPPKAPIPPV